MQKLVKKIDVYQICLIILLHLHIIRDEKYILDMGQSNLKIALMNLAQLVGHCIIYLGG
jgi:hypothetical protein